MIWGRVNQCSIVNSHLIYDFLVPSESIESRYTELEALTSVWGFDSRAEEYHLHRLFDGYKVMCGVVGTTVEAKQKDLCVFNAQVLLDILKSI